MSEQLVDIDDLIKPPKPKFEGDPERWEKSAELLKPTGDAGRGDIIASALDVAASRRDTP